MICSLFSQMFNAITLINKLYFYFQVIQKSHSYHAKSKYFIRTQSSSLLALLSSAIVIRLSQLLMLLSFIIITQLYKVLTLLILIAVNNCLYIYDKSHEHCRNKKLFCITSKKYYQYLKLIFQDLIFAKQPID